MSKFKPYPEYKDSGIEWVGDIPKGWKVVPFFSVMSERRELNIGLREKNLLSLSYGSIVNRDIDSLEGLLPESFETYQIIYPSDIIFRLTDLQNDKKSLRSAIAKEKGIITSAYLAAICKTINAEYAQYLFRFYDLSKVFYSMGGGLRQSMRFADMKRLDLLLPSHNEQKQIALFLNHETARMDELIAEQKRLIELLKEKRQAVISHAVTKGLDSNAPMKDSGIEWLGEVPEHWNVKHLKRVLIKNEGGVWGEEPSEDRLSTVVLRSTDQSVDGHWKIVNPARRKLSEIERTSALLHADDLLVTKSSGSALHIGKTTIVTDHIDKLGYCYGNFMQRLRVNTEVMPKFAWYFLNNGITRKQLNLLANTTTGLANLTGPMLGMIIIPLPSYCEQKQIINFLDNETRKIDALIQEAEKAIELMKERRSALISAAVTGKIDVRDWQPEKEQVEELAS